MSMRSCSLWRKVRQGCGLHFRISGSSLQSKSHVTHEDNHFYTLHACITTHASYHRTGVLKSHREPAFTCMSNAPMHRLWVVASLTGGRLYFGIKASHSAHVVVASNPCGVIVLLDRSWHSNPKSFNQIKTWSVSANYPELRPDRPIYACLR